jgi:hypothetical protein
MLKLGYYLIRQSDQSMYYVSADINPAALERVCDRVLNDRHGYDYTVRRFCGLDIDGREWWAYAQEERFMDAAWAGCS